MDEQKLIDALTEVGYEYDGYALSNVNSINKLSSDLLTILSTIIQPPVTEAIRIHEPVFISDDEMILNKFPFRIQLPFNISVPDLDIRRKGISDRVFGANKYPVLTSQHLEQLFPLYDYYFFTNMISYALNKVKGNIVYELSDRMTRTGGTCKRDGICTYVIKVSSHKLNQLTPQNIALVTAGGVKPRDRVEALQLIFEHELLHAVVSIFTDEVDPHGPLFKEMALNLFGQTKITHGISKKVLNNEVNQSSQEQIKTKNDFMLGQFVYFIDNNQKIVGKIIKLNPKTARVNTDRGVWKVHYSNLSPS